MNDAINRKDAIGAILSIEHIAELRDGDAVIRVSAVNYVLRNLPSAQSEVRPIDYQDCSNAMLMMWMDNVVTDGEYNRIMDKLNAHWGKKDG
jgi:hypothetical protein